MKRRPVDVLDAEQVANADDTQLEADDHDDEPADCRREQSPEFAQQAGQADLHQAGEHRHPKHGRKSASAGRQYGGADIDRRKYRRRQISGADRTFPDALQYCRYRQSDHPQTQRAERRRIAGAGVPENNDDQNQIDRQQHRVLHAEEE